MHDGRKRFPAQENVPESSLPQCSAVLLRYDLYMLFAGFILHPMFDIHRYPISFLDR